jgi:hypothetical protein
VIGKICPRGEHVSGLIYYLFGAGRSAEHTDPHLVAGWRHPAELEPPLRDGDRRDFRKLSGLLQQPHSALGEDGLERPVWHCSVRAAPGDRMLSDDEWAHLACVVMDRTGLSPYGQEDDGVRWIAVRHAADHIHIVAMLARQDGGRPRLWNDYYRVGEACRAAEQRFGMRSTSPRDRTAARRPTRAESEKAQRNERREAPRVTLHRAVSTAAAGASNEAGFFARLEQAGVLIRKRFSTRDAGQVTGFAVALTTDVNAAGGPVWFGGGKLAADLTLPRLRQRWEPARVAVPPRTPPYRSAGQFAGWDVAARTAAEATRYVRRHVSAGTGAADDTAWATADTLRIAAAVLGGRPLWLAADAYDRAARLPNGRIPRRSPAGEDLRQAARLLASGTVTGSGSGERPVMLIARLAALVDAIAELREAQRHAAQAVAARRAAERLHAAIGAAPGLSGSRRGRPRTRAGLAALEFPFQPGTQAPTNGRSDGMHTAGPDGGRPPRRPMLPRPRGPTR